MHKIIVLAGLLLCSISALAQSPTKSTPAPVLEGKAVVPVSPVLPGEENLTARERVERDMLMPTRRRRTAALQAAEEAEETTTPEMHGAAVSEEAPAVAEPAAKPAAPVHRITYHRRTTSTHRRTGATHRRPTARKKPAARRTTTAKRH